MFFSAGISNYVWILYNKKEAKRAGKVQRNGMKKSLGSGRKKLGDDDIERIVDTENISLKVDVDRYFDEQVAPGVPITPEYPMPQPLPA